MGKNLIVLHKFWEHLLTSENTLVFKNVQATKNFNPWLHKLYSIFNSLGFSYIAESNCSIKALLPNIKQMLIDQCTREQSSKIYSSTKLKFYQHLFDFNRRSGYVDILRNKTER
jgi:UDP-galactopyranose mutase